MDAEWSRWLIGLLFAAISTLIALAYRGLRDEQSRLAKNVHELRNRIQAIVLTLASKGIKVPKDKDEE